MTETTETIFEELPRLRAENKELRHAKAKLEVDLAESDLASDELRRELEPWRAIVRMMRPESDQETVFSSMQRGARELEELRLENKSLRAELKVANLPRAIAAAEKAELAAQRDRIDYYSGREPFVIAVIRESEAFRRLPQGSAAALFESLARLEHASHRLAKYKRATP